MAEQRLIDANALLETMEHGPNSCGYDHNQNALCTAIKKAPTINPETLPVVQDLRKQLTEWDYWFGLDRRLVLENARKDQAAVNSMRKHCEKTIADLRAELAQVKKERDAAVKDLETAMGIDISDRSKLADFLCGVCDGKGCEGGGDCHPRWCGPGEE